MSQSQQCKEKPPSNFSAVGTRCYCCLESAVTPLRHLVGTSQVCGVLFLFSNEPQAWGLPRGWQ